MFLNGFDSSNLSLGVSYCESGVVGRRGDPERIYQGGGALAAGAAVWAGVFQHRELVAFGALEQAVYLADRSDFVEGVHRAGAQLAVQMELRGPEVGLIEERESWEVLLDLYPTDDGQTVQKRRQGGLLVEDAHARGG